MMEGLYFPKLLNEGHATLLDRYSKRKRRRPKVHLLTRIHEFQIKEALKRMDNGKAAGQIIYLISYGGA